MVRIGKFEVNVLTCVQGRVRHRDWSPAKEYKSPNCDTYEQGYYASKYIVAPQATDSEGNIVPTTFAVQFKLHGPLSEDFMDGAELIVFRIYHDDKKIGSSHIKRKDWERSLTYTVRKSSRRFWLQDQGGWVSLNWHLDEGLHGQLRIEVWRQIESSSYSGSWDAGLDIPFTSHEGADYIDYFDPAVGVPSKETRVRFTKRLNGDPCAQPDAKFVFEYRTEDTMRTIGIISTGTSSQTKALKAPIYDLTEDDDMLPKSSHDQRVYDTSDGSMTSPSRTVSSNHTLDDLWSSSSVPNNDNYYSLGLTGCLPTSGSSVPLFQPDDLYSLGYSKDRFPMIRAQRTFSSRISELPDALNTQGQAIDLTETLHTTRDAVGLAKSSYVQENVIDLTMED